MFTDREDPNISFGEETVPPSADEEAVLAEETHPAEEGAVAPQEGVEQAEDQAHLEEERRQTTKKFISNLQRERFRALEEARELRDRVAQLEEMTSYMNDGFLKQYEANAKLALEKARAAKKHAIEQGDTEAMMQADEEMARSVSQIEQLKLLPPARPLPQERMSSPSPYEAAPPPSYYEIPPQVDSWLEQNSWCDERSADYDPDKAAEVLAYAAALDTSLARQGRTHEYYTRDYFARINEYARSYDQNQRPKSLNMKTPAASVAPVRHTSAPRNHIDLTPEDREMARMLKVAEKDYLKYKKQDMAEQRQKGASYGYR